MGRGGHRKRQVQARQRKTADSHWYDCGFRKAHLARPAQARSTCLCKTAWGGFKLAETCKGSGAVKIYVPEAPFADEAAYETWKDAIVAEHKRTDLKKVLVITEETVRFE